VFAGFDWSNEVCKPYTSVLEEQNKHDKPKVLRLKLELHLINDYISCEKLSEASETKTVNCDKKFLLEIIKLFGNVIDVTEKRIAELEVLDEKLAEFYPDAFDWQMTETGLIQQYNKTQCLQMTFTILDKFDEEKNEKVSLLICRLLEF